MKNFDVSGPTVKMHVVKRARTKRVELEHHLTCPYLGCERFYGTRTALKLHMKRMHKINDPVKKNLQQGLTCLLTSTQTKGVDFMKVLKKSPSKETADSETNEISDNCLCHSDNKMSSEEELFDERIVNENLERKKAQRVRSVDKVKKLTKKKLNKEAAPKKNIKKVRINKKVKDLNASKFKLVKRKYSKKTDYCTKEEEIVKIEFDSSRNLVEEIMNIDSCQVSEVDEDYTHGS